MEQITKPQPTQQLLHNQAMEAAVLHGLLTMQPEADFALCHLNDDCFCWLNHQKVFRAIREVYNCGKEVSVLSVTEALSQKYGQMEANDLIHLSYMLMAENDEAMSLSDMSMVLKRLSQRRQLGPLSSFLQTLSFSLERNLESGVAHVQRELDRIMCDGTEHDFVALPQLLDEAWQHAQDNLTPASQHLGLQTGIAMIDREGGLCEGLTIVGARPSHGKSAFALFLALQAMKAGKRVAFFSMEMSNLQLTQRLLAMESGLSPTAIARMPLSGDEMRRLAAARQSLLDHNAGNFCFDNSGQNGFDRMMQTIRALKRNGGLDVVVVDYMQLMDVERQMRDENTARMLARASHQMQQMGRDEKIYFLCLSQLNRTQTGIPTRNQLRDSGGIDEAADNVILLYRASMDHYSMYPMPYDNYPAEGTLLLLLDKCRNGATGHALIGFEPKAMHFVLQPQQPTDGQQVMDLYEAMNSVLP